jgi:hypothetical protein
MKHIKDVLENSGPIGNSGSPVPMSYFNSLDFLRFPLQLFNTLLFKKIFTKRQILIIMFITRFSIGCRRSTANLKLSDFTEIGLWLPDVKKEILKLIELGYIGCNKKTENIWITQKLVSKSLTKNSKKVSEILTRNLVKH